MPEQSPKEGNKTSYLKKDYPRQRKQQMQRFCDKNMPGMCEEQKRDQ